MKYYVGIDLGGTNIAAGVVDEHFNIVYKDSVKTGSGRPADDIMEDMATLAKAVVEQAGLTMEDITSIGVGSPGTINKDTGIIEYSNNIKFYDVPLRKFLENRLHKEVFVDNDANAAAYGEFIAGSAKGANSAVAITLGTGIGSGIIVDKKILTGFNFAGAELGHTVIEVGGRPCTCGRKGCFEAYGSASALIELTKEAMQENKATTMWQLCEENIQNVSGKTAFEGLRAGDETAKNVVDTYIKYLACGITNAINIFQPEILCIGGGICKEGDTLLLPLKALIENEVYSKHSKNQTKIVVASLGNDAGIIGAAMLQ